jgi:hypothetical protein
MTEAVLDSLILASESVNPLLEILWKIDLYERQGCQLIDLKVLELEDFAEATVDSQKRSSSIVRSLHILKRANPIASPTAIRGF